MKKHILIPSLLIFAIGLITWPIFGKTHDKLGASFSSKLLINTPVDGSVTSSTLASGSIVPSKTAIETSSGVTTAIKKTMFINGSTVRSKLTGSTENLVTMTGNEIITDVWFLTTDASGVVSSVDVGADINYDGVGDVDGFISAANSDNPETIRMSTLDEINQTAYAFGLVPNAAGAVTVTASTDLTTSTWDGGVFIEYLTFN